VVRVGNNTSATVTLNTGNTQRCGPLSGAYLSLNVSKKMEMMVDYRKRRAEHAPIYIDGAEVEWVESFKFLGVNIANKLSWFKHTKTVVKRARQCPFPLSRLKRWVPRFFQRLYSCTIESILTSCITAW
jgi:hypothetical protein